MTDKKTICKYDDYIESKSHIYSSHLTPVALSKSLAEFKLDKIFPKNISINLNFEGKENTTDNISIVKNSSHLKLFNNQ
jgi:hypothetical protein